MHELGHALVARRQGIEVKSIQLFLFGGLTQMSRDASSPGEEFKIAAAGPLATFGMVIVFLGVDLAIVGPNRLLRTPSALDGSVKITPVLLSLSWLLLMNILVLVFNLVPAFPLDGGRIARAIVWRVTGDKQRGTRAAAQLGQGFAVILGRARHLVLMLAGAASAGLWLVRWRSCSASRPAARWCRRALTERIEGVRVSDIMDRQPVAIPSRHAGQSGARRVLPALRLVVVPGGRRERPVHGDRPAGASADRV